jgi:hypothetical protein
MPGGATVGEVDERWNRVGKRVLKQLSLGELHAIGRLQIREAKYQNPAPIPQTFWHNARFTYWFLDEGPSTIWDADSEGKYYAEIEVRSAEAVKIWPEYISLFEAATYAFEELRFCPIAIRTEVMSDSSDAKLIAYANLLAKPPHGKPLIGLQGREPPAREPDPIDVSQFGNFDFIVEDGKMILKERYSERRFVDLSIRRVDLLPAIEKLAAKEA